MDDQPLRTREEADAARREPAEAAPDTQTLAPVAADLIAAEEPAPPDSEAAPAPARLVDLNAAPEEELRTLPGVGRLLAARLVAARPFGSLDDITHLEGISTGLLERLRPLVTVQPPVESGEPESTLETPVPDELVQPGAESPAPAAAELAASLIEPESGSAAAADATPAPVEENASEPPPQPARRAVEAAKPTSQSSPSAPAAQAAPRPLGWSQLLSVAFLSSLFTLILAVALSLGLLSAFNGGNLRYSTPAQIANLQADLRALDSESAALQGDIDNLRARLDSLEPVSGRVSAVESGIEDLHAALEATDARLQTIDEQIDQVDTDVQAMAQTMLSYEEQISELQSNTNRFQGFLEGLRSLLEQIPFLQPPTEDRP